MATWQNSIGLLITCLCCLVSSDVQWNRQTAHVQQGENLTVTCTVTDVDHFGVVRVVLKKDGQTYTVSDNDALQPLFENTGRYKVYMDFKGTQRTVAVAYMGIRGEDAGDLGCHSLDNQDEEAVLRLNVDVPVSSVVLTGLDENGEEYALVSGDTYTMKEGHELGITCVANIDGTQIPPRVQVHIGGKDATGDFSQVEYPTEVDLGDRLVTVGNEVKLSYVTTHPNWRYNDKQVECTAMALNGGTMKAVAYLNVLYAPVVSCKLVEYFAQVNKLLEIVCDIRANPAANATYLYKREDAQVSLEEHPHRNRFGIHEKVISGEHTKIEMKIDRVHETHFGTYYIRATNAYGVGHTEFVIHKGATDKDIEVLPVRPYPPTLSETPSDKPTQKMETEKAAEERPQSDSVYDNTVYGEPVVGASNKNSGSVIHVTHIVTIVTLALSYCLKKLFT